MSDSPTTPTIPLHSFATPQGYYTFVPHPAPPGAATNAAVIPGLQGPPPTDPAAVAAVAAALTALAPHINAAPQLHVVTGIPPGLAALLRSSGPWSANVLYSVAPTGPLAPIDEAEPAPEWYCVSRGRFVGVMNQYAQAHWAIRSISNAAHKAYTTQDLALQAFNAIVGWGGIEVPGGCKPGARATTDAKPPLLLQPTTLDAVASSFALSLSPPSHPNPAPPSSTEIQLSLEIYELNPIESSPSNRIFDLPAFPSPSKALPSLPHFFPTDRRPPLSPGALSSQFTERSRPNLPSTLSMARLSVAARAQIILTEKPTEGSRMEELTEDLTPRELQALAELLGLGRLSDAAQSIIPRVLPRALAAAQTALQHQPPSADDAVDTLIRNFDLTTLHDAGGTRSATPATPPPSSPELPVTPPRRSVGPRSAPSTPAALYHFASSSNDEGYTDDWLKAGKSSQGLPRGAAQAIIKSPKPHKAPALAWVVFFGHTIAVFTKWIQVPPQIKGVANAYQSGFPSVAAAEKALAYARAQGWTGDSSTPRPALPTPLSYAANPLNSPASDAPPRWYVVTRGRHTGLFSSGLECHLNITGYKNALHNSYTSREQAERALAAVA
ncbi:hypothetical protein C8R43DRAFT_1123889 [Mycena crocata]|nr:hypothetical protein C8R43DRAFT_1123889 [Mycena crocata]